MKVIETQQAYMLDNNTKEIPDVQTLEQRIILQKIKRKHMKIVKKLLNNNYEKESIYAC